MNEHVHCLAAVIREVEAAVTHVNCNISSTNAVSTVSTPTPLVDNKPAVTQDTAEESTSTTTKRPRVSLFASYNRPAMQNEQILSASSMTALITSYGKEHYQQHLCIRTDGVVYCILCTHCALYV